MSKEHYFTLIVSWQYKRLKVLTGDPITGTTSLTEGLPKVNIVNTLSFCILYSVLFILEGETDTSERQGGVVLLAEKLDRKRLALKTIACPNSLLLPFRTPATQAVKTTSAGLVQKKRG